MRKQIIAQFPQEYERYIEVFGGAAWVMIGKEQTKFEVYNDLDGQLVNLFRVVKFHADELFREFDGLYVLNSRELLFNCISQLKSEGLTDIQRAARFLISLRFSFGSDGRTFCCTPRNLNRTFENILKVRERFKNVVIENKPYDNLIKVYDRSNALFYLDPPYYGTEDMYDAQFLKSDHERLRDILNSLKGKFLLSYNDCDYIRELYSGFTIISLERQNNLVRTANAGKYKELLVKNY